MRALVLAIVTACLAASCATQTICDYVTCVEGDEGGGGEDTALGGGGSS
jgi:hypothetical protein